MKASTNLVKESNKDTVYILLDNLKYPFGELPTFNRICSGDKITQVPNTLLEYIPQGAVIDKNVQLVKANDRDTVYLVQYGIKRPINDPDTFNRLGLDWTKIAVVQPCILQLFKDGQLIVIT